MSTRVDAIRLKKPDQVAKMAEAGRILSGCLSHLSGLVQPGLTTEDLDVAANDYIRGHGGFPGFLNYQGYPKHLCVSVNDEVVHGIPGSRTLQDGDLVSLDCGVILDGWWADSGCSVPCGEVSPEALHLLNTTREALEIGIAQARPGNYVGDIGHAVQRFVESQGYSVVRNYVGHGIGRNMHEAPQVPNYGEPGTGNLLRPGYVLAIEPMVNMGAPAVRTQDDQWTVVTVDGGLSCYFEHTVAITEDGPRVLTRRADEVPAGC